MITKSDPSVVAESLTAEILVKAAALRAAAAALPAPPASAAARIATRTWKEIERLDS
jgi:hypothetical protein